MANRILGALIFDSIRVENAARVMLAYCAIALEVSRQRGAR
jgi:hypothetical protein